MHRQRGDNHWDQDAWCRPERRQILRSCDTLHLKQSDVFPTPMATPRTTLAYSVGPLIGHAPGVDDLEESRFVWYYLT